LNGRKCNADGILDPSLVNQKSNAQLPIRQSNRKSDGWRGDGCDY
jgi:hypothetical protein